jgi:plasmid stabilization system protein ParE
MPDEHNRYVITISDRAAEMIVRAVAFVARVNADAAEKLRKDIIDAISALAVFPERNPYLNDASLPPGRYRKMLVQKRYLIIYQIRNNNIYVDYMLDCRQDYKWLL